MNKEIKAKALEGFEKWFTDDWDRRHRAHIGSPSINNAYLAGYQQAFEDRSKAMSEIPDDALKNEFASRFVKLQEENKELRNGTKGACPTCEPVGELNKELEKELHRVVNKHTEVSSQIEAFDKHAKNMASQASKHMRENEKLRKYLDKHECMRKYFSRQEKCAICDYLKELDSSMHCLKCSHELSSDDVGNICNGCLSEKCL